VVAVIVVLFLSPFAATAFGPEVLDMTETGETERQRDRCTLPSYKNRGSLQIQRW